MTVFKRSFATWHGDEGWMAFAAYVAIIILPFLLTGVVSAATNQIISDVIEKGIAYIAAGWLFLLVIIIMPFRLWREQNKTIDNLSKALDTKKQRIDALTRLGELWERSTDYLNLTTKIKVKDYIRGDTAIRLKDYEEEIYKEVEEISPGEISTFRTLGSYNPTDHPKKYQPEKWDGDERLLEFSERLLRVRKFIDKHSPPSN